MSDHNGMPHPRAGEFTKPLPATGGGGGGGRGGGGCLPLLLVVVLAAVVGWLA